MSKYWIALLLLMVAAGAVFLLTDQTNIISFIPEVRNEIETKAEIVQVAPDPVEPYPDIENQQPLQSPPSVIKAIYSTNWSAGSSRKINYFLNLIDDTELNAIIVDIKDYSGIIPYKNDIELVNEYNAWNLKNQSQDQSKSLY